jgi:hypothetical protein
MMIRAVIRAVEEFKMISSTARPLIDYHQDMAGLVIMLNNKT